MRTFRIYGKGTFNYDKIKIIGGLKEPDSDTRWLFYEHLDAGLTQCLREDILRRMYLASGTSTQVRDFPCIGVYESKKRLRVVPFCSANSPRNEETIIAYRELITGKDYALPLSKFNKVFTLDFLYDKNGSFAS